MNTPEEMKEQTKATVMGKEKLRNYIRKYGYQIEALYPYIVKRQAEISFKAGMEAQLAQLSAIPDGELVEIEAKNLWNIERYISSGWDYIKFLEYEDLAENIKNTFREQAKKNLSTVVSYYEARELEKLKEEIANITENYFQRKIEYDEATSQLFTLFQRYVSQVKAEAVEKERERIANLLVPSVIQSKYLKDRKDKHGFFLSAEDYKTLTGVSGVTNEKEKKNEKRN